jgi:hypothetical protein
MVGAVDFAYAGVVAVARLEGLAVFINPLDVLVLQRPVEAVVAGAEVDAHGNVLVVGAEHTHEFVAVGDYRAVEHPGDFGVGVDAYDGVVGVPPKQLLVACGFFLPWDVGEGVAVNLCHVIRSLFFFIRRFRPRPFPISCCCVR